MRRRRLLENAAFLPLKHRKGQKMKVSGKLAEKGLHAFDGEPHMHAGIKVPRLWIVVADREKAHIYRKTAEGIERIADAKMGHDHTNHESAGSRGASHYGYDARSKKIHH